jgi:hypothetical protein
MHPLLASARCSIYLEPFQKRAGLSSSAHSSKRYTPSHSALRLSRPPLRDRFASRWGEVRCCGHHFQCGERHATTGRREAASLDGWRSCNSAQERSRNKNTEETRHQEPWPTPWRPELACYSRKRRADGLLLLCASGLGLGRWQARFPSTWNYELVSVSSIPAAMASPTSTSAVAAGVCSLMCHRARRSRRR